MLSFHGGGKAEGVLLRSGLGPLVLEARAEGRQVPDERLRELVDVVVDVLTEEDWPTDGEVDVGMLVRLQASGRRLKARGTLSVVRPGEDEA
ncbi:MAG: hypothetical protein AAF533_27875 [Acidobacteriota bacterium]